MDNELEGNIGHLIKEIKGDSILEDFKALDHVSISKMSDVELAIWQAKQSVDSPHHIFAIHEWNRRLLARELKSNRYSVWASIVASLGGVVLGVVLTKVISL